MLLGQLLSLRRISGIFWDELLTDISANSHIKGINAPSTCLCTLISQFKFPHPQMQGILKLMVLQHAVCNTMRPGTGSGSKTSPSSHIRPFSPSANCFSPDAKQYQKAKEKGQSWPHLHHCSYLYGILHTYWCPIHLSPACQMWLFPSPQ